MESFSFENQGDSLEVWKSSDGFWHVTEAGQTETFPSLEVAFLHVINSRPRKRPELRIVKSDDEGAEEQES